MPPDEIPVAAQMPSATASEIHYATAAAKMSSAEVEARGLQLLVPPEPPQTVILGSDQMSVRIAWIEPPGQGVVGYRVYVDGQLAPGQSIKKARELERLGL